MDKETLDNLNLSTGIIKENITTKNIAINSLKIGQKLSIGKDVILEDSIVKNQSSSQTEDLLRKIFSYYKTPILLTEIFKW